MNTAPEPILTDEDLRIWAQWERAAIARSKTQAHQRAIDASRGYFDEFVAKTKSPYLAFSGGKDSCAMIHLVASFGYRGKAAWLSGDFDWPGESKLVADYGSMTGLHVDVLRAPVSSWELLRQTAPESMADEDTLSSSREKDSPGFFATFERYRREHDLDGVLLGMRAEESRARRILQRKRGGVYYAATRSEWVCQPICRWTGLDVYAYLLSRGLPVLHLYRCLRIPQRVSRFGGEPTPDRVRHDGWLPGAGAQQGEMIWLRVYYPSLFRRLCAILPDAKNLT